MVRATVTVTTGRTGSNSPTAASQPLPLFLGSLPSSLFDPPVMSKELKVFSLDDVSKVRVPCETEGHCNS
jgi:hypothetical protein